MKYVIGIDSGGTNYRLKACDLEGNELGYYVGIPANHYSVQGQALLDRINSNIDGLLATFNGRREDAAYILCGTTGVDSDEDALSLHNVYSSLDGFNCPVKVINDAELAHYTVTGGYGVLLISGTGAIAFARSRDERSARAGGWLFTIMGDEGSGAWVTRTALRYLGRFYDGAIPRDELVTMLEREVNVSDRNGLNCLASRMGTKPWYVPSLGYVVDSAAKIGNKAAISIMQRAAREVFNIVVDVVNSLKLDEAEPDFNLGLWGSNILKSKTMLDFFLSLVKEKYPKAVICFPEKESIDGAVELALKSVKGMQN